MTVEQPRSEEGTPIINVGIHVVPFLIYAIPQTVAVEPFIYAHVASPGHIAASNAHQSPKLQSIEQISPTG